MLAVVTMVFGATLVWTCCHPLSAARFVHTLPTNQGLAFWLPASIHLAKPQPPHLQPGIRQTNSPSSDLLPKDRGFVLAKPVPIYLDKQLWNQPLRPGVYQTYPYSIILVVPGRMHDDSSVLGAGNTNNIFKMPIIRPHLKVIPRT